MIIERPHTIWERLGCERVMERMTKIRWPQIVIDDLERLWKLLERWWWRRIGLGGYAMWHDWTMPQSLPRWRKVRGLPAVKPKKSHFYEDLWVKFRWAGAEKRQYSFETKQLLLNHIRGRKWDREENQSKRGADSLLRSAVTTPNQTGKIAREVREPDKDGASLRLLCMSACFCIADIITTPDPLNEDFFSLLECSFVYLYVQMNRFLVL